MAFEAVECNGCEEPFTAYSDAEAARRGYCSPRCHLVAAGEGG